MPMPQYDVLIIGSGAAGGTAAWTLTQKGANCLLLDAGPLSQQHDVRRRILLLPEGDEAVPVTEQTRFQVERRLFGIVAGRGAQQPQKS